MSFLRRLPPTALKFAAFAAVCLVLLVGLAAKIGNLSLFSSRHVLYAQLHDVTGLTTGSTVDIAGVQVGQVSGIAVQRGHALVTLSVDNTVALRRGTAVGLRWHNVIGQKEVYLYPVTTGPLLANGATIGLSHDVTDASVDQFLNALGPLLSSINVHQANEFVENVSGALQGDTVQIDQLIDNSATISATVGGLDTQVGAVITSLDQVLTAIANRSGDVGTLVANLQTVASSLSSRNTVLDDVVGNLSNVAGELANVIGTNRSTLNGSIDNLESVARNLQANESSLAAGLSTAGEGLAPYTEISSWGQWFQVQTVYDCLANQTECSYFQPTNPPAGAGPGGGPPLATPALPGPATAGGAVASAAGGSAAQSSIPQVLGTVAGAGSSAGSSSGSAK